MAEGPSLLQRTWYMLDSELDRIKDPGPETDTSFHRVRAGAIAEVLAMFMVPHFNTRDEIAEEAVKRWKARQAGDHDYETAGLGMRKYEPPPVKADEFEKAEKSAAKKAPAKKTGKTIPDAAVATSKQAIEMKMFTVAQIAKTYGMSEAEVKAQLGLP